MRSSYTEVSFSSNDISRRLYVGAFYIWFGTQSQEPETPTKWAKWLLPYCSIFGPVVLWRFTADLPFFELSVGFHRDRLIDNLNTLTPA